ncbi:MAG: proline racemase family protein [Pseudomonadota bacterium]
MAWACQMYNPRTQTEVTDVELAGDILRVAFSGLPQLKSETVQGALRELKRDHEAFRDFVNQQNHGAGNVNACLLYPPFEAEADAALILASQFAYAPLAGTALMAAAAHLGQSRCVFETAAGSQVVELSKEDRKATWFTTAPERIEKIDLEGFHSHQIFNLTYVQTGLPYLVCDVDQLELDISDHRALAKAARQINSAVKASESAFPSVAPEGYDNFLIMMAKQISRNNLATVWVSDAGYVANSAGGTGALAVLAAYKNAVSTGPVTIKAPGGNFICAITGANAFVTAKYKIISRQRLTRL